MNQNLIHSFIHSLAIIILLFIASCSTSSNNSSLNDLPSWYVNPTQNNFTNLYGVGEGFTLSEAKKSALQNLASKLKVTISSESSSISEVNNFAASEEFRQRINEKIENISFTNYQVTNSSIAGNNVYVEVAVDRAEFIKNYKARLVTLNQEMKYLNRFAKNKSILEKRNHLAKIVDSSLEAESIVNILSGLDSINPATEAKYLKQYNQYRQNYDNILNKIEFYIKLNASPKAIGEVIINALNKEKLKVVKAKNSQNKNLVIIDIATNIVNENIYNSNIAKLKLNFSMLSNNNKIIASNEVAISGSSAISSQEAVNAAAKNLSSNIESEGILVVLGIEK